MLYEQRKHDGTLPIIGVNTFVGTESSGPPDHLELARSSEEEKRGQLERLRDFQARHNEARPSALAALQHAVLAGENVFDELMKTVRHASLGEISTRSFRGWGLLPAQRIVHPLCGHTG